MREARRGTLSAFALAGFLLGGSAGAFASESSPPAPPVPGNWVLLKDDPKLWREAGGEDLTPPASADAGARVAVVERRIADDTAWLRVSIGDAAGWLPEALLAPPPAEIPAEKLRSIGDESVDRFHGIGPDYAPPDLVDLPKRHGYESDRTYRLRAEAAEALERMIGVAAEAGIRLKVVSGYRAYETQRGLYLKKLQRSGWNQDTVAKPGHSEHQLGTAVDLTDGDPKHLLEKSFGETKAGRWLAKYAPDFGFAVSYTEANSERTGYAPEPWHYRYFGVPAARGRHSAASGE